MWRADVAIPGGEPLIHKEIGEIVPRSGGTQEIRVPLHQRVAVGKETPSVRAFAISVFLGASDV